MGQKTNEKVFFIYLKDFKVFTVNNFVCFTIQKTGSRIFHFSTFNLIYAKKNSLKKVKTVKNDEQTAFARKSRKLYF